MVTMLILLVMVVALSACVEIAQPLTGSVDIPHPAYVAAQSTLDYGQNQMNELSHQATMVALDMVQAANVAEQVTLDYNQRQMMELAYQATAVSLNMTQAVATQQSITEQTQVAWNMTATAHSQAATATYSAYILYGIQTIEANATATAHSLTATPFAALQAEIVRARKESDRRALWDEFVVTPLKVSLFTLVVFLLIAGGVLAYRQLMPVLELRLRTITREDNRPYVLVDGMITDVNSQKNLSSQRRLHLLDHPHPGDDAMQVEIIDPSEPSITNWITEAEQKLRSDGWV